MPKRTETKPPAADETQASAQKPPIEKKPAEKKYKNFSIAERRLQTGDVFGLRSTAVVLKDQPEPMEVRWINTKAYPQRLHVAIEQQGWQTVTMAEIANRGALAGTYETPDGYVARGDKTEQEVLVKMPKRLYKEITLEKDRQRRKDRNSLAKLKDDTSEAAAKAGDLETADRGAVGQLTGEVKEYRERHSLVTDVE